MGLAIHNLMPSPFSAVHGTWSLSFPTDATDIKILRATQVLKFDLSSADSFPRVLLLPAAGMLARLWISPAIILYCSRVYGF